MSSGCFRKSLTKDFAATEKLMVAGLQLIEEPHVLDGDRRLVGEGLHQGDLTVGERMDLMPMHDDDPEQLLCPQERDDEYGPVGLEVLPVVGILRIATDIVDVDGSPLEGGPPHAASASRRERVALDEGLELGRHVVGGRRTQEAAVEAANHRVLGVA